MIQIDEANNKAEIGRLAAASFQLTRASSFLRGGLAAIEMFQRRRARLKVPPSIVPPYRWRPCRVTWDVVPK